MQKTPIVILASSLCLAASPSLASDFVDRARIVETSPVVETVRAAGYRNGTCEVQQSYAYRDDSTGEKIVGGLLGAAAGSAFGKGGGKRASAAIGAVVGSQLADKEGEFTGEELLGAVLGGAAGSQIGKGSGRTAATAIGALSGSMIADRMTRTDRTQAYSRSECTPGSTLRKAITGYEVTFEYGGVQSTGYLPYRPEGEYVDIHVNVELLEDRTQSRRR